MSKSGFYLSTAKAFILVFLALAVAVGVGIIVHFAGPTRNNECKCNFPTTDGALEQCKNWARDGKEEICTTCQSLVTSASCPTTKPQVPNDTRHTSGPMAHTAAPPFLDVRLPTALNPLLYIVELQPHMYSMKPEEFTFSGSVKILFHCVQNTNNVTLHINKLNITGPISVTHEHGTDNLYLNHETDVPRQFLVIHIADQLRSGQNYTVDIPSFVGPLAPGLSGLYLSSYTSENETIYLATTMLAAIEARTVFPCQDEPAIKAEFDVTLVRKDSKIAISNMPVESSESRGDGWVADKFERTPKMSTYLLAFIICDFDYKEDTTTNGVRYRSYSRPEAVDQAQYSIDLGMAILTFYEEFFNISYPLPKQDMIAIPDFPFGGMENWGLITYRENTMLYEPGVSSEENKQQVAVAVSHELAHQWFGNLVTPSWWDDIWLNEGFASYVEYMGMDSVHPDWKMFELFVVKDIHVVFDIDGLISSHPIYVPVSHPDEIGEIFDKISYDKGASIIRMMRFFLGDDTFQHGITNYLNSLRYDDAFHDDLWFALGNQSVAEGNAITNVKEIMDTWTLQMNYPVVMVTYDRQGQITLSQKRYLLDPNAADPGKYTSPFGYKWHIPFAYTTSMTKRFNVTSADVIMLNKDHDLDAIIDPSIPAPTGSNWVLGNPMQYGYYRINYDERNWIALIEQLKSNHVEIHTINRAQIINDAWSLARSGDLSMSIALKTTEYLNEERELVPWTAASRQLGFVSTILDRHPLYGSFLKFMQDKTTPTFEEVTMNNTGATHLESYLRSSIISLACEYGIQDCLDESKRLFSLWMANPQTNPIDPGIKSIVYCTAIAEGGINEWEFALDRYRTASLEAEKLWLLSALACSKHIWILSKYLEMALDDGVIRRQDAVYVMRYVSRNTIGRSLAWDFFRAKWDFLFNDYFKGVLFAIQRLIGYVTENLNTESELLQFDFEGSLPSLCERSRTLIPDYTKFVARVLYYLDFRSGEKGADTMESGSYTLSLIEQTLWFLNDVKHRYTREPLKEFMDSHPDLGAGTRTFDQALERTQGNFKWMSENVPILEKWLHEQGY